MSLRLLPPDPPRGAEKFAAWWDEAAAQKACAFFRDYLRHTEGEWAGRPFELQPWQRDRIIRPIFGWKRADKTRLIRQSWIEIPRKNGKTELAAGLALLALLGDAEMGGQGYALATNAEQARIVFNKARTMVRMSDHLRQHLYPGASSIFCPELLASFKPLSARAETKEGFSPTFAVGDEVHRWASGEPAEVIHKGTGSRRQPLEIYITTAGVAGEGHAWEMHELALAIERGEVIDPSFLPVIFAAPDDADWRDEATWRLANPNFGVSIKPDFMRQEADRARRSPRAENDFRRYFLNQWTEQSTRWLPMDGDGEGGLGWAQNTADPHNPGLWRDMIARMEGRRVFGGIDLSLTRDLSAVCWCSPPEHEGERWLFAWRAFLPEATVRGEPIARRNRYEAWAQSGALTVTEGNVTDHAVIRAAVNVDAKRLRPVWIGIDPFNGGQLMTELRSQDGLPVEQFRQGFLSMSPAAKGFERLVAAGLLEHGSHPVAWQHARNAAIERDAAGNIKPSKARAADKIDLIVAAVMAHGGAANSKPLREPSVHIINGIAVIG